MIQEYWAGQLLNGGVSQWLNLPEGVELVERSDYQGKVLYLYFFQSWCPGCHSSGFPTLKAVSESFAGQTDVAFVAIQSAFEGASANTFEKAGEVVEKYQLTMPVGHAGNGKGPPDIMRDYRTGGTPWTVIIDKEGRVRFNDFHIQPADAATLIQNLR